MPALLLPWCLSAAYTPDGRVHSGVLPVLDVDTPACFSIEVPTASDAWCVSSCAAGTCPEELCQCGAKGEARAADAAAGSAAGSGGRDGAVCAPPPTWCVHAGATDEPKWCGGIPGHYCHDTEGQSGFKPCNETVPATWGTVQCLESSCACSSTCDRDAALRSASGHCGQALIEDGCTHERLYAPSQPGTGIVVLERNEVYRVNDIIYCSTEAPAHSCTRARLDARTIMCESVYRGTLLRKVLAKTCTAAEACADGCEDTSAAWAEPLPGYSYGSQQDAARAPHASTDKFLAMGGPGPRIWALSRFLEDGKGKCTPATATELVVPVRMGDKIPQSPDEVIQMVVRALKNPARQAVQSVVFNAVMHYGHNVLTLKDAWVRTPATDQKNLDFIDELFTRAEGQLRLPARLRSEPLLTLTLAPTLTLNRLPRSSARSRRRSSPQVLTLTLTLTPTLTPTPTLALTLTLAPILALTLAQSLTLALP